jgi:tetratricopeptide (TPR) repeat protein
MRSWFQEGEAAFAGAASRLGELEAENGAAALTVFWGMALARQGWFTFQIGRQREGRDLLAESLAILRPLAATQALVFSLNYLAAVTYHRGDYDEAQRLSEEGLALSRAGGDRYGEAIARNILSQIFYLLGRYPEAKRYGRESLGIWGNARICSGAGANCNGGSCSNRIVAGI